MIDEKNVFHPCSFLKLFGVRADIKCPMKSFRIPLSRMTLSEDAFKTALEVNSICEAECFLDTFGSHVSNGRQEVSAQTKKQRVAAVDVRFERENGVACPRRVARVGCLLAINHSIILRIRLLYYM